MHARAALHLRRATQAMIAAAVLICASPLLLWCHLTNRIENAGVFLGAHKRPFRRHRLRLATFATLPDWWQVLCGSMSIIGPRPIAPHQLPAFAAWPARFDCPPGLVGLHWLRQRSNIDFVDEGQSDCEYIARASLAGDLALLLRCALAAPYGGSAAQLPACQTIQGIRLLNLSRDEVVDATLAAIERRVPTHIAFVNPDCVNLAAGSARYRALLKRADWVCADGIGMKIAGRLLGRDIRQNVNGTDIFPALCAALEKRNASIYLLGAREGVAEKVAEWIRHHHPRLRVTGTAPGYLDADQTAGTLAAIAAARTDVLLVAMGAPRQEQWLAQHLLASGAVVGIGVGGLFDFYSGRIPRAPLWLREIGLEWLYRLIQEPGRMWRRYLVGNFSFLWRILRERRQLRVQKDARL